MMENGNESTKLDADLAALHPRDAAPDVAARARARALSRLAFERAQRDRPLLGSAVDAWSRFGVPAALVGVVGVYLTWAVEFAGALYR